MVYKGKKLDDGFRVDLIVNDLVIVEIKSVESLADVHFKQVLTYLRLSGKRLGLLINVNEALIKDGIKRVVNGLYGDTSQSPFAFLCDFARVPEAMGRGAD